MSARTRTTRRAAFIAAPILALALLTAGPASAAQWDTVPSDSTAISTGQSSTVLPGGDLRVDVIFGDESTWPDGGLHATVVYTPAGGGAPVTLATGLAMQPDQGVTLTAPLSLVTADQSGAAAPVGTVTTTVADSDGNPLSAFGGTWHQTDPSSAWSRTENVLPTCLPTVPVYAHAAGSAGGGVQMSGAPDGASCEDGPAEMQTIYGPGAVTITPTSPLMARFVAGETVRAVVTAENGVVVGDGEWIYDPLAGGSTSRAAVLEGLTPGVYTVTWTGTSSYRGGAGFDAFTVEQAFRYVTSEVPVTPEPPVVEPVVTPEPEAPIVAPEAPAPEPAAPAVEAPAVEAPVPAEVTPAAVTPAAVTPVAAPADEEIPLDLIVETGVPETGSRTGLVAGVAAAVAALGARRWALRQR